MSKQLKYRLKKTLKNAEFVHADLEYHQELSGDAVREFQEEVSKLLAKLSVEDKQRVHDHMAQQQTPNRQAEAAGPSLGDLPENADVAAAITEGIPPEEATEKAPKSNKARNLKKIFRRIAEKTHPDKLSARGLSGAEALRLGKLFLRASEAHNNQNWYTLYSIALGLGISLEDPDEEQVDWIEEDIKKTLAKIAALANLTAWHWYTGDEDARGRALKHYFLQVHGFDHPEL
tara:strand:- start:585 stop:1280 length:696 start_codon:yes stop_codon:yes gene_type:complete